MHANSPAGKLTLWIMSPCFTSRKIQTGSTRQQEMWGSTLTKPRWWKSKTRGQSSVVWSWKKWWTSSILAATSQLTATSRISPELWFFSTNRLQKLWRSPVKQNNNKLNICKSNICSVLLEEVTRLRACSEGQCLCQILWEYQVTNREVSRNTGINNIVNEV